MGAFDDLIPANQAEAKRGAFDDLIPGTPIEKPSSFIDRALGRSNPVNILMPPNELIGGLMHESDRFAGAVRDMTPMKGFVESRSDKPWIGNAESKNPFSRIASKVTPRAIADEGTKIPFNPLSYIGGTATKTGSKIVSKGAGAVEGATSGFVKKALGGSRGLRDKFFGTAESRVEFVEGMGSKLSKRRSALNRMFGNALDRIAKNNPDKSVNLRGFIDEIGSRINAGDTRLPGLIESKPLLKRLLDHPELAENMPLREVQNLKNSITSGMNPKVLRGLKRDASYSGELDLVSSINRESAKSFEELTGLRKFFGEKAEQFKKIHPTVSKVYGEQLPFFKGPKFMGTNEGQVALKKFAPKIYEEAKHERFLKKLPRRAIEIPSYASAKGLLDVFTD